MAKLQTSCVVVLLLLTACNRVYREYDKESFPSYLWERGQEIKFTPKIDDVSKSYQLVFGLRHVYGLKLRTLAINVVQVSPSGKETSKEYQLTLMDDRGEYVSSCGGDLCDIEAVIESDVKFSEPGVYNYFITHNMPLERIPGVMEVGFIINKEKEDE